MTTECRIDKIVSKFGQIPLALLLVSIGPVQEFIAEARKTRDLWAGSYLLSKVTFETMTPVLDCYGHEVIIMPDIGGSILYKKWLADKRGVPISIDLTATTYASLPNHFLAIVPDDEVQGITKEITKKTKEFLPELGKSVKEEINQIAKKSFSKWADLWDFQLKDHFQVMWVSIPVIADDLGKNYLSKHDEIQRFMEERKITRTFDPWQGNSAVKCSQCGHREVMGPPKFTENREFWDLLRQKSRLRRMLNKSEKLCAVCLLKRMVKESELSVPTISFDSTSDIASIPFRKVLKEHESDEVVKSFIKKVDALDEALGGVGINDVDEIPGDWLYKEALDADKIIRQFQVDENDEGRLEEIKKMTEEAGDQLQKIYESLECKPSKYYAILNLDADKMGEYLSGKKIPSGATFSLDWQTGESSKLVSLGCKEWPDIIKKWDGATIYSGGDDLLAFGPVTGALTAAAKLREAFRRRIGTTISGCIVIVHHTDSLRRALEDGRSGLDLAKDLYDRNSLVITLKLSSGTTYTGGYHWDIDSGVSLTEDFIGNLVNWISTKKTGLSPAFVYDLLKETEAFYWTDHMGKIHLKSPDMLIRECNRLLKRHISERSPIWKEKGKVDKVINSLVRIANPEKEDKSRYSFDTKENLDSLLKIIAFLAREE